MDSDGIPLHLKKHLQKAQFLDQMGYASPRLTLPGKDILFFLGVPGTFLGHIWQVKKRRLLLRIRRRFAA